MALRRTYPFLKWSRTVGILGCFFAVTFAVGCKGGKASGPVVASNAAVFLPKPFVAGGTAFLRVKQYKAKPENPEAPKKRNSKPALEAPVLSFGDALTLVERIGDHPVMWVVSKDQTKAKVPEYMLTTSKSEVDFLNKAGRVPVTMAYAYMQEGHMAVWGSERVDFGFMRTTVDSEGLALIAYPSGTSPFALAGNAVIFDAVLTDRSLQSPPVFDAAKRPFPLRSTTMYYCASGEEKPAFEAIDLRTLAVFASGPEFVEAQAKEERRQIEEKWSKDAMQAAAAKALEMVRIPPGQFVMGSPANEKGHQDDEVAHLVTLTHPFEIGRYKVTQGLWQSVMGTNPSDKVSCGPDCPVETISWDEVQVFLSKLNSKYPGKGYRLPTEAEWEYSCRAGDPHARYGDVDSIAWYGGNSENTSHPVGQKQPNAWGLYDMIGNVYEYCQDCYGPYPKGSVADPQGPMSGSTRVRRGGSYTNITGRDFYYELTGSGFQERYYAEGKFLRAASRESHDPKAKNCITGFRLARSL